jgi:hypothetical protein
MEQARVFLQTRLLTSLEQSPLVRRTLFGAGKKKTALGNMQFENGSVLYTRAAYHSADSARGISADLLLIDEFQDVAAGDLPVLQETLSHADFRRTILTGTPKLISNHLEAVFSLSTAMEWHTPCPNCDRSVIFDERCLGLHGSQCPECENSLNPQVGEWIARNPSATWGEGYWINHLMVPWLNYDEILDRHRTYDLARFKNEVLGLSSIIGEHVVTRAELEACCSDTPMAKSIAEIPSTLIPRYKVIAGIDWGGSEPLHQVSWQGD